MATTTVDYDSLSLDEIRKRAEEEAVKASTKDDAPPADDVKDDAPPADEAKVDDDQKPKVFYAERSFDLGDGAGSQVFKGKGASREEALEDLSNKLLESQKSATRRIKELKAAKPAEQKGFTKEEESLLAAEVITSPSHVVEKILKSKGIDLNELPTLVEEVRQNREAKQRKTLADQFVVNHPDFLDNDRNGQRLAKAVKLHGEFTLENLEKAYQDLSESGLLEVKGEEAGGGQDDGKQATRTEPTANNTPPQRTKRASGVSTHGRSAATASKEPTEAELNSMSLEELRQRANKQLAGQ